MTRVSYTRAWIAYRIGDFLEFKMRCPTFAGWIDWLYEHWRKA